MGGFYHATKTGQWPSALCNEMSVVKTCQALASGASIATLEIAKDPLRDKVILPVKRRMIATVSLLDPF